MYPFAKHAADPGPDRESVGFWNRTACKHKTEKRAEAKNTDHAVSKLGTQTGDILGSLRFQPPPTDDEAGGSIPLRGIALEHPIQPTPVESVTPSDHAPELVILRNTFTKAPNITLNRYYKATQGQLLAVACFGIIL